jgi:hypothetical protein
VRQQQRKSPEWRDEHRESLILLGNAIIKRRKSSPSTVPLERAFIVLVDR